MPLVVRLLLVSLVIAAAACESKPPQTATTVTPGTATSSPPSVSPDAPAAQQFAAVSSASTGSPKVFGSYTRGCVAGAIQLPLDGPHWQVANPARNRAWGHPGLIAVVQSIATKVAQDGHNGIIIGDLAQPRGGPMPTGHASHQVGLDADIWLHTMPAGKHTPRELDAYNAPPLVDFATLRVTSGFGDAQYSMLKHAAQSPGVERIFISPPIKRAMCERTTSGDRSWLRKIRPWTGHAAHMHVRIACPADSDDCKAQDEPPEGDGCGAELQSWFDDRSWMKPKPGTYVPSVPMTLRALPAACMSVLTGRG